MQVASTRDNYDKAKTELNSIRLRMKECDSQISSILKEQRKLQQNLSETKLERKKLENEVILFMFLFEVFSTHRLTYVLFNCKIG